jgi:hypothetical protein
MQFFVKLPLTFLLLAGIAASAVSAGYRPHYAVAVLPAPVLNSPDFAGIFGGQDGRSLRTDASGLIRAVEFVALPGTPFTIDSVIEQEGKTVYRVTTEDYPYPSPAGYFVDSRFVRITPDSPPPRPRSLPSLHTIIERLLSARGSAYVWGGNVQAGIPEMLTFFPPAGDAPLDPETGSLWQLKGVDCSGLLYEATGGFTPRNTSSLVDYGEPVPVAGLQAADIVRKLEPLDLIAWPGHVLIVLDRERVIESRLGTKGSSGGVRVNRLRSTLERIMASRAPADRIASSTAEGGKRFVVRRWYTRAVSAHP